MFEKLINNFQSNPKRIFLLDGFGALLSAFLLRVVLVKHEIIFGIPPSTLYVLASIPILFALFDVYSYLTNGSNSRINLKVIAIANIAYCVLSVSMVSYHYQKLTYLGWIYILLEIFIIMFLAIFELKIARSLEIRFN